MGTLSVMKQLQQFLHNVIPKFHYIKGFLIANTDKN